MSAPRNAQDYHIQPAILCDHLGLAGIAQVRAEDGHQRVALVKTAEALGVDDMSRRNYQRSVAADESITAGGLPDTPAEDYDIRAHFAGRICLRPCGAQNQRKDD